MLTNTLAKKKGSNQYAAIRMLTNTLPKKKKFKPVRSNRDAEKQVENKLTKKVQTSKQQAVPGLESWQAGEGAHLAS